MSKILITINCNSPSFQDSDGQWIREQVVADILDGLQSKLESGLTINDLHGDKIIGSHGDHVGVVLVAGSLGPLTTSYDS